MVNRYSAAVIAASALGIFGCGGDGDNGPGTKSLQRYYQGELTTSASRQESFKVAVHGDRLVGAREPDTSGTAEAISLDFVVKLRDGNNLYGEGLIQFNYPGALYDPQPASLDGTADETGIDVTISATNAEGQAVEYQLVVNGMPSGDGSTTSFAGSYTTSGEDNVTANATSDGHIDISVAESCDISGQAHNPTGHTEVQGYTMDSANGDCPAEAGEDGVIIPTPENGGFYLIYNDGKKNNPITYFTLEPVADSE